MRKVGIMARKKNTLMLAITLSVAGLLTAAAIYIGENIEASEKYFLYAPVLLFQALWLDRLYIIGHEAAHRKLFPKNRTANEFWGFVILLPLMVPLRIYRKIHDFHHTHNRISPKVSSLDVFTSKRKENPVGKSYFFGLWYFAVFAGGFFLHSLVSVLLFLFVPVRLSKKISPAFKDWSIGDQLNSILQFAAGAALHLGVYYFAGTEIYLYALGYPMLLFAWIWSMMVYIFHYRTSTGENNRYHARALRSNFLFKYVLLNFNEHVTHHADPGISWFDLPEKRKYLPEEYAQENQKVNSLAGAILQQLKGPTILWEYRK